MMYGNKIAAAIKVGGKVLREFKDTVYIPFGSEYSILVKNLETKRACVNIYLDGECVSGGGIVLNAGQEVDLERFIKNGNLSEGNRFKFIERTAGVEQHRGIKLEDGLIRIEHQFEYVRPVQHIVQTLYHSYPAGNFTGNMQGSLQSSPLRGLDVSYSATSIAGSTTNMSVCTNSVTAQSMSYNDAGITVPGSKSEQKFSTAYLGQLEAEKFSMVIKLLGETPDNKPVIAPVTVKHKPRCQTCNKQNKANAKFCTECGTALEIFA